MAKKKVDLVELELLEGRNARMRFQLKTLEVLTDYIEVQEKHPSTVGFSFDGTIGLRGLAVRTARVESGRLYSDEQIDRYAVFIEGLERLGIISFEPSKHLPTEAQDPKYRMIRLVPEALNDAKTRIQNQP